MRKLIPNIVNEDFIPTIENIDRLACDILCHLPLPYCETELVQATIECKKSGHKPHRDFKNSQPDLGKSTNKYTPNPRYKNCIMACSVLLTDPSSYKGGSFHFYNHEECIREEHYLSALVTIPTKYILLTPIVMVTDGCYLCFSLPKNVNRGVCTFSMKENICP